MSGLFDQVVNYSPPLLTSGQVNYDGTWNAATNTPTLVSPPDALSKGDYYVVSAAGTQFSISFAVGDWIISNGTAWEKVDLTDAVSSVFGRTGAVVGVSTDYSAVGLTNTAIGAANPSTGAFTSLSSSSTTTLNGTTIPASKTLVVTTDKLSALAATTSAELAGVISDETGSGSLVFANSPTLVTPALGTPSALVGTNITGTAAAFNINGTVGATTPSTVAATSVTALSDSGYQAVVGQLTSGDRVGISGQASGSGTALVFFDNAQSTFRPAIFDASSHSLKISGVEKASVTSTGLQGAIGATTASTGAFTTVTASSTIAATGAVTGSNLSGTNTGDQTITLTGGVTGSGTGSFAATVVTNANLTGAITSVGNATSLGSFTSANLASALTDETGSGANVFATSPTLVTPILGTPQSGTLTSCTGLPISTGVSGLGTGVATALAANVGSAGAPVVFNGALGTPSSGTVTNLTGTASININGTVGATTPSTVAATTISASNTVSQDFNGAGGNSFTARYNSSNPRGGVYVQGGSGKVFFGENLVHSTANVFVADKAGTAWALADSGGSNVGLFYATGLTAGATAFDFSTTTGRILSVTSTGLNSTAIGASTPSTGAFTTLYQGASGAQGLNVGFSGAAGQGFTLRDTTNSRTYFITTETATGLQINSGANPITLVGNTNVTGALSATGNVTLAATSDLIANKSVQLSDGTAGTATGAIFFINDTDTGFYRAGANTIGFMGNGASLGTWSPTGLQVTGALSCTTGLTLNDGSANSPNINFQTTSGTRIMDMDGSTVRILNMAATNARLQLTDAGNLSVDGTLTCVGALAIGNTVNTVSPTSPNRTVTIVIGGTTYYLAAKTTND